MSTTIFRLGKKRLVSDSEQVEAHVSTFCDIFDFSACLYSFNGYDQPPDGATLCAAFNERGADQSSLVGVELGLKAVLAGIGVSDKVY